MRTLFIALALIMCLSPLKADAANKKVKSTEVKNETLYICGVTVFLGMSRDEVKKSISGCDDIGSDKYNITLLRNKNVLGVISFNENNRVISAYRDWYPTNDTPSELVKTLVNAINSIPENVRFNNSANAYTRNDPEINEHSMIIWFKGKKSIRLETLEVKQDKQSYVSIREYLAER